MLAFNDPLSLILLPLGETSPATTLTYLASQVLYVGSHLGDSQLVRISPTPTSDTGADTLPIPKGITTVEPSALGVRSPSASAKGKGRADVDWNMDSRATKEGKDGKIVSTKGSYLDVIERWENVAPIVDAAMVDLEGSGQVSYLLSLRGAAINPGSFSPRSLLALEDETAAR